MRLEAFHYHGAMTCKRGVGWLFQGAAGWLLAVTFCSSLWLPATALAQAEAAAKADEDEAAAAESSDMNGELFLQLLLGELQVQAREPGLGYSFILEAARRTGRAELFKRSVDIALQARSGDAALTAAAAWSRALPADLDALRYQLQILLALNRPAEIAGPLRQLIQQTPAKDRDDLILAIPQTLARTGDKAAALQSASVALKDHLQASPHAAAAWVAMGRLQLATGQSADALASTRRAMAANPRERHAAALALELMEQPVEGAEALVRQYLQQPVAENDATGRRIAATVRLAYARMLLDVQRYSDAGRELEGLSRSQPELADTWLWLGTLQVQQNQLEAAGASLQRYLELSRALPDEQMQRGQAQAFLQLSRIAEKRKDYQAANAWLDRIENADEVASAQLRRATLLARQGKLAQARELLRQQPERNATELRRKLSAEAQLMRDIGDFKESYRLYEAATARFPDDMDLYYEQAMVAEKDGRMEDMERLLRLIIGRQPDYHHAYNALGYSLADRKQRLSEARVLIAKALEFAPGDPYIQDSLGWVEYRMGNLTEAQRILRKAFEQRPDAEIAAHLGEVLWMGGRKDEARATWREGLLVNPENETLLETLRRFRVQP